MKKISEYGRGLTAIEHAMLLVTIFIACTIPFYVFGCNLKGLLTVVDAKMVKP